MALLAITASGWVFVSVEAAQDVISARVELAVGLVDRAGVEQRLEQFAALVLEFFFRHHSLPLSVFGEAPQVGLQLGGKGGPCGVAHGTRSQVNRNAVNSQYTPQFAVPLRDAARP